MSTIHDTSCPRFAGALERVGRRWTGSVVRAAAQGARRFDEYRALIEGISDRLLSQRLKELESAGLLERAVVPSTPVQIRPSRPPSGLDGRQDSAMA
ncbi:helix-turn-helix domain-containing protein [Streptomyces sp. NPDC086777]|uniref:winged helix-turn-helix transcriptional regulator n=1 Tax=Streptomyces sp. NPDC086777 TaxID=3154866 RepID=UPI00344F6111